MLSVTPRHLLRQFRGRFSGSWYWYLTMGIGWYLWSAGRKEAAHLRSMPAQPNWLAGRGWEHEDHRLADLVCEAGAYRSSLANPSRLSNRVRGAWPSLGVGRFSRHIPREWRMDRARWQVWFAVGSCVAGASRWQETGSPAPRWESCGFARRPGDFGQMVPLAVIGFGFFCQNEPMVTLGMRPDKLQRKNKTVFPGIVR